MGVSSIRQLEEFTGLPRYKIGKIRDKLKLLGKLPKKSLGRRQIERLLLEGELTQREIARLTRTSFLTIQQVRGELRERGIETNIGGLKTPPAVLARVLYRLMALDNMGVKKGRIKIAAGNDVAPNTLKAILQQRKKIVKEIQCLANGRYWKKAQQDLKDWEPRLKSEKPIRKPKKTFWKFNTDPAIMAQTLYKYEVLRTLAPGKETAVRKFSEEGMDVPLGAINHWLEREPRIVEIMKELNGGKYWRQAQEELKEWVAEQERFFRRKFQEKD